MKKVVICLIFLIFLCGCQNSKPEYLISSIGVDTENGLFNVCFETVIINSESPQQNLKLIKGSGDTLKKAVLEITRECTQPILLSHCALIAIGESVTENQLNQILDYCYDKDEITLSAFFIKTENAEKLLSQKPVSSVCVGYDIMGLIEQYSKLQNKNPKNRFFEVVALKNQQNLPKIILKEKGYYIEDF